VSRREFPAKVRAQAFERAGGCCEADGCGVKLGIPGAPAHHFDHVLPDGLGGRADLENCEVLCAPCHRAKTSDRDSLAGGDVQKIAKANRLRAKAQKITGRKAIIPGSRASNWKRRIDGTVERRS